MIVLSTLIIIQFFISIVFIPILLYDIYRLRKKCEILRQMNDTYLDDIVNYKNNFVTNIKREGGELNNESTV